MTSRSPAFSLQRHHRRGITLVEVLATIVMMGIILPAAMHGISLATAASLEARRRSEAAALAEAKLSEILATGDWQFGSASGDFGEAWPDYRWGSSATSWASDATMMEVYVRVTWTSRTLEREVVLTTLVYPSQTASGL